MYPEEETNTWRMLRRTFIERMGATTASQSVNGWQTVLRAGVIFRVASSEEWLAHTTKSKAE